MTREEPNQTSRTQEYSQAADSIQQISPLLRATSLLDEQTQTESIAVLLLACLTATDGLGCPRAVLLLRDADGRYLRGYRAEGIDSPVRVQLAELLSDIEDRGRDSGARSDPSLDTICYKVDSSASPIAQAVREGRPMSLSDAADLGQLDRRFLTPFGTGAVFAVPLRAQDRTLGVVVVELQDSSDETGALRLLAVQDVAGKAARALRAPHAEAPNQIEENLFSAIDDISRAGLSANRLEEVLKLVVERATKLLDAAFGIAWVYETGPDRLRLLVRSGRDAAEPSETLREATARAQSVIKQRRAIRSSDADPGDPAAVFLYVPLVAFDEVVGAIALLGRREEKRGSSPHFTDQEQRKLELLGTLAAAAVENARLFDRVRESSHRLHEAERLILHTEKLAALGEMSAKVAHEIRTPLSSIGGFARRIEKALPEKDPNRSHASIIVREIARLEAILSEQLQLAKTSKPRMRMVSLRTLVRETVLLVREAMDRKGVQFVEQGAGGIPPMLLDADRVKQVLLNILSNALASTRQGHTIRLRTRASEGWVQIEIANNGEKMPGEILEQLFVPFATAREGGCGLGLAVADQIVREHGGEIRVRTSQEWSAIFIVSLPIRTNEDRRQQPDRRGGRDRRRAA